MPAEIKQFNGVEYHHSQGTPSVEPVGTAEEAVIGALLIDNSANTEGLTSNDFDDPRHRIIFSAITTLISEGKAADLLTVTEALRNRGKLEAAGGSGYIASLPPTTPSAANTVYHASIVREASERRRLEKAIKYASEATQRGESPEEIRRRLLETTQPTARPGSFPEIKSGRDIMHGEYPDPSYLVEKMIPDVGVGLMVGPKAAGKTQALLSIAAGVSVGGYALGGLVCTYGRVLYLQLELSERRVHERLNRMSIENMDNVDFAHQWPTGPDGLAAIEAAVKQNGYSLVIIDTLAKVWTSGQDMDGYKDSYNVMGPLREVANRLGITILCGHHRRKAAAEDEIDSVMGSTGIAANADVILILKRARGTDDGSLLIEGNDVPSDQLALRFDRDSTEWFVTDADPKEASQTPERRDILRYLREHGSAKSGMIAEAVGKSPSNTSNLLKRMKDEGLLISHGYGIWGVPKSTRESSESSESDRVGSESSESSESVEAEVSSLSSLSQGVRSESSGEKSESSDDKELDIF